MTKEQKIISFDPSQPGLSDANIYGLPFTAEESEIIVIPAPWEVTVSYGAGASDGPETIYEASYQVDLLHQNFPELWKLGIHYDDFENNWKSQSDHYKKLAQPIIKALENGDNINDLPDLKANLEEINAACEQFNSELKERTMYWLNEGKKVILLGGDHSTPLGYYQAMTTQYQNFGILHFDAHMDLRIAYEGFTFSHASIMYNAIQMPEISKLVQVGIRDFSEQEVDIIRKSDKIIVHTDTDLKAKQFEGKNWSSQVEEIISQLPENILVSIDIDALYRWYCPNTGTPVPGGLSYEQLTFFLNKLSDSNKNIIGMDLVEVAPGNDEWDGNVGTRLLFHMCGVLAKKAGLNVGNEMKF